jgi:hypothetical protein
MASPSYISKGVFADGQGATVNVTYPGSINTGDLIFLLAFNQQELETIGGINTPSGFTHLIGGGMTNGTSGNPLGGFELYYKVADGTETGTVGVTRTGTTAANTLLCGQIYLVRGVAPLAINAFTSNVGSGVTATWGAITLTGVDRLLIAFTANNDASGIDAPTGYDLPDADTVGTTPTAELAISTKEDVSSDGLVTASGGSIYGWGTAHVAVYNWSPSRSFIVN